MARRGACLPALAFLLWACSGSSPGPTPRPEDVGKVSPDRIIARALASGELTLARRQADSLLACKTPLEREAGLYWKAVVLLYANQVDSALAIFEARSGKWSGGLRTVHSEAFLRLTRELSLAGAAIKSKRDEHDRTLHDRIEGLQKETGDLRTQIGRLETEKQKYEKLLKDLETIR